MRTIENKGSERFCRKDLTLPIKKTISISVIIPCRNEEKHIGKCLDSLIASNFPKDRLEVFVVDGISEDKTVQIVNEYAKKYPFINILNNTAKVTPVALNIGIREAQGEYIIILSSHSEIDSNFLKLNLKSIEYYNVDCVGGHLVTLPADNRLLSKSIAIGLSHPFGVGNSYFRIGSKEPKYVDTVPFGCYRKNVFEKIGFFDEDLIRNQDDELNLRLLKRGGKILLLQDITSYYYARDSILKLWKMYFQYGYFKPLVASKVGGILTWRQLIPALFVTSLTMLGILSFISRFVFWLFTGLVALYLAVNLFFLFSIAKKKGFKKYIIALPAVFATIHFSYGTGYLKGIWDFIILKKHKKKNIKNIPLTR